MIGDGIGGVFGAGSVLSPFFPWADRVVRAGGIFDKNFFGPAVFDKTARFGIVVNREEQSSMYTVTHTPLSVRAGEPVRLVFTVTDRDGAPVALDAATAAYRLARRTGGAALLEKTDLDGIVLTSNTAAVEFGTGDLASADGPPAGDYFGQLAVTLNGDALVVAEGIIRVRESLA